MFKTTRQTRFIEGTPTHAKKKCNIDAINKIMIFSLFCSFFFFCLVIYTNKPGPRTNINELVQLPTQNNINRSNWKPEKKPNLNANECKSQNKLAKCARVKLQFSLNYFLFTLTVRAVPSSAWKKYGFFLIYNIICFVRHSFCFVLNVCPVHIISQRLIVFHFEPQPKREKIFLWMIPTLNIIAY